MTSPPARPGPQTMTRPRRNYQGWLQATIWSRCAACGEVIDEGQWQGLAMVPEVGRRWVHEACAYRLGQARRPDHDRGITHVAGPGAEATDRAVDPAVVRVLVMGSLSWPRERAVVVDAGADVVLAFPLTRDPVTGASCEDPVTVDAIARAERAGLAVFTHLGS